MSLNSSSRTISQDGTYLYTSVNQSSGGNLYRAYSISKSTTGNEVVLVSPSNTTLYSGDTSTQINAGEYFRVEVSLGGETVKYPTTGVYQAEARMSLDWHPRYVPGVGISGSGLRLAGIDGDATLYSYANYSLSNSIAVSNAASSTYPRHNYTGQITSICAIIPVLLRRCSRG